MLLLVLVGFAIASAMALSPYDRAGRGVLLGLCLGPIGLIIALVWRSNLAAEQRARGMQNAHGDPMLRERRCPHCAELVLAQAKVCKHCHRDIEPLKLTGRCPACGALDLPLDARECASCHAQFNALSGQKVEVV